MKKTVTLLMLVVMILSCALLLSSCYYSPSYGKYGSFGRKQFASLSLSNIESASVVFEGEKYRLDSSETQILLETCLRDIILYDETDSWKKIEKYHSDKHIEIVKNDETSISIAFYGDVVVVNGVGYNADAKSANTANYIMQGLISGMLVHEASRRLPYADLMVSDVEGVEMSYGTYSLEFVGEELEEFLSLLNGVVVYEQDDEWMFGDGCSSISGVTITVRKKDGASFSLQFEGDVVVIENRGYICDQESCEGVENFIVNILERERNEREQNNDT